MGVAIHKPGQGYWTRVMTATAIGILTFATAGWLWQQMIVVADKLPRTSWTMTVAQPEGQQPPAPSAGQQAVLLADPARGTREAVELGTGTIRSYDVASRSIVLGELTLKTAPSAPGAPAGKAPEQYDPGLTRSLKIGESAWSVQGRISGEPTLGPRLLAGSAAAVAIIIGFIIAYYFCAIRASSVEFLISTDMEMKKVHWTTRKDIISSTWVVILASFFIAAALFTVDIAFKAFFEAIGVLAA